MIIWVANVRNLRISITVFCIWLEIQGQWFIYKNLSMAIYVSTDNTGRNIEFACLLSNMIPKVVKRDHFNYESGTHNAVEYDIEFTCTQYCSPDVNTVASLLLKKYRILTNYLNFKSDYLSQKGNTLVDNRFEDANIADWSLGEGENSMNTIR